ncbi:MAG: DNA polymerase IV, partial [Gammaproteobacteria bacterium]|nr:DNA polymerase IV [Gammaproteobacteria bacterium]
QIKQRIKAETQLTASIGIAPNKLVAKIASDLEKPDGIVEIRQHELPQRLDDLPVKVIPGIGKVTLPKLQHLNIHTMQDLRLANPDKVRHVFGKYTQRMQNKAAGIDQRQVREGDADKSISHEITFDRNIGEPGMLMRHLQRLSDKTATRLRTKQYLAATLQIKLRTPDFQTFTRQTRMHPASADSSVLLNVAKQLLERWLQANPGAKLRLLGVGVSQLSESSQLDLFAENSTSGMEPHKPQGRPKSLDETMDDIKAKFGKEAIKHGQSVNLSYTERETNKIDKDDTP